MQIPTPMTPIQKLSSSVAMSAMSLGQGLHTHLPGVPLQQPPSVPLFKKGTAVNMAHSESAQKQSNEAKMGTLSVTPQPFLQSLRCLKICLLSGVCNSCNNMKR